MVVLSDSQMEFPMKDSDVAEWISDVARKDSGVAGKDSGVVKRF